jgi:alkylation response protein AidB-like acyl-CoA dehydrogenase
MRIAGAAVELAGLEAAADGSRPGRYFRDAKVLQIVEGTNQIQKNAIVRELLDADVAHLGTARV